MRVLITSVLLLAASFLASHALAGECTPVAETRARAQAAGASFVQVLDRQAVSAYAALYNAQPPVSDESYSVAYLVILPDGVTVITLGNGEALCAELRVPSMMLEKLMQRVLGVPV